MGGATDICHPGPPWTKALCCEVQRAQRPWVVVLHGHSTHRPTMHQSSVLWNAKCAGTLGGCATGRQALPGRQAGMRAGSCVCGAALRVACSHQFIKACTSGAPSSIARIHGKPMSSAYFLHQSKAAGCDLALRDRDPHRRVWGVDRQQRLRACNAHPVFAKPVKPREGKKGVHARKCSEQLLINSHPAGTHPHLPPSAC